MLIFALVSFVSFTFISALIFMISYLLLTLGFFISPFSSCLRCKVSLFIWFFFCFWGNLVLLWTIPLSLLLLNPIGFGLLCFHFCLFLCIFWFLFWFLLWFVGYSEMFSLASISLYFFNSFFLCCWHLILLHCDQKRCLKWFQLFLNLLRLHLWPKMWCILDNVPCALEKKMKFIVWGWNV